MAGSLNVVARAPSAARVRCDEWDWFPLQVQPQNEMVTQILLEDRGFATFCPRVVKWRCANKYDRAKRQKRRTAYPWLPGLVIVGMKQPYRWHDIDVRPVTAIISTNPEAPRPMCRESLWRLMRKFESGRFIAPEHERWMRTGQEFAVGDRVTMAEGPLSELTLKVVRIRGQVADAIGDLFGIQDQPITADLENLVKQQ